MDLLSVAWGTPWGACAVDNSYPMPRDIRAIVGYALQHGWIPERRGGVFVLPENEHAAAFPLTGFLLTDRLRTGAGEDPTARVTRTYGLRHRD
jgi:hypothetical protein